MKFLLFSISSFILGIVDGHSFLDIVGTDGGVARGAYYTDDLLRQRLYCPLATLAQCQPPAKHGIVLSTSAMRRCRKDDPKSHPMAQAVRGQDLYLHWAGNGHTSSNTSCVSVSIAPYAVDPDDSTFTELVSCLPFARGPNNTVTDGLIRIPASTLPGDYTIFWEWFFGDFWFSSCADIRVVDAGAVTTIVPPAASNSSYTSRGCGQLGADFCKFTFGPLSYCKNWAVDACGRSLCHGIPDLDTKVCPVFSKGSTTSVAPTSPIITSTTVTRTTASPTSNLEWVSYLKQGCLSQRPNFCQSSISRASYCVSWQKDTCGRSRCHGDTRTIWPACK
jgi:hypothetical protein